MIRISRLLLLAFVATGCACAHRVERDHVIDYMALCHAVDAGDDLLVRALLDRGAPVNPLGPDVAGDLSYMALQMNSPLQAAAERGNVEIVRLLIARGAWLDQQCCDGPTPLGFAARAGHTEIVRMLLQAGADPSRESQDGTPLEAARKAGHVETARALELAISKRR